MISAERIHAPPPLRALVADSRRFFASGVTRLLATQPSIAVEAETGDVPSTVEMIASVVPDVALVSYALVEEDAGLLGRIRAASPRTAVIVHGLPHGGDVALEALRAGARGLVDQEATLDDLIAAVEGVAAGRIVISPHLAAHLAGAGGDIRREEDVTAGEVLLSPREREILRLVAGGASNRRAAAALGLSEHTVRAHLRAVMRKLNVRSRVQAVALAMQRGLLSPAGGADDAG